MGDKVTHIVTDSKWDDNFDEASFILAIATYLLLTATLEKC